MIRSPSAVFAVPMTRRRRKNAEEAGPKRSFFIVLYATAAHIEPVHIRRQL